MTSSPILLLDSAPCGDAVTVAGKPVAVTAPAVASPAHLRELRPACVVANLASAGVLEALAALREAGWQADVWGCLIDAATSRSLPLGLVEPAVRPLDPDAVLATLAPRLPRGGRVVTVGADVDALVGLRYALTRRGLSVAMAWNARQAEDLLTLVRPHAAVLDLGMPEGGGCSILARLAGNDPPPTVVLVAGEEDPAPGLRAALAAPSNAARAVPVARLLDRFLDCVAAPAAV